MSTDTNKRQGMRRCKKKVLYFDASDDSGTSKNSNSFEGRVCIICNSEKSLRSVRNDYFYFGAVENYVQMIENCFGIQFDVAENEKVDAICPSCVEKLRSVVKFRKEVEQAHRRFNVYLTKGKRKRKALIAANAAAAAQPLPVKPANPISDSLLQTLKAQQVNLKMKNVSVSVTSKKMLANKPKDLVVTKKIVRPDGEIKQEVIVLDDSDDGLKKEFGDGFEYDSDDNWSVSSKELDRATGHPHKIVQQKFVIPDLDLNLTQCPVCNIQYLDYAALATHYYKHYPQSLCHICGYRSMNSSINSHLESHSNVRYPCTMCDKTFKASHSMTQHVKSFHNKDKLYKCTKCDEKFSSSMPRRRHMMAEHGLKFNMLQCSACEKTFFAQHQLKKHFDSFHLKKKNVFCSYCGDGFFSNASLKNHILKHTGTNPDNNPQPNPTPYYM